MHANALLIENLSKRFRKQTLFRDFSLAVAPTEFLCVLGKSGVGKSTLLRMIAGLEAPNKGTIRIEDTVVNQWPPEKRNVSYVFQDTHSLFPHLSVLENIEFPVKIGRRRPRGKDFKATFDELIDVLDLSQLLRRDIIDLSGGERQRVALARALIADSSLLLLDEPTSSLDNILKVEFWGLLRQTHERYNCSTLLVTHDEREAQSIGSALAILDRDCITQHGPTREVLNHPQSPTVARLLGGWNLLTATHQQLAAVVAGSSAFPWPAPHRDHENQNIIVGFREDQASLAPLGPSASAITAKVTAVVPWYGRFRMNCELSPLRQGFSVIANGPESDLPAKNSTATAWIEASNFRVWTDEES